MVHEKEARETDARAERLAAALRANLRRRKNQARARDVKSDPHADEGAGHSDSAGASEG